MILSIPLSTGEVIYCSELSVKYYKEILKSTYGEEHDEKSFIETVCNILSAISDKPKGFFCADISLFDLFLMLVELRIQSMGDEISLVLGKEKTLTFNLQHARNSIKAICSKYSNLSVKSNQISLNFQLPSATKLLQSPTEEIFWFLHSVDLIKENKNFIISNPKQAKSVLEKIPARLLHDFQQSIDSFATDLQKTNFLEKYNVDVKLTFAPSVDNLIWYTKLLFNESLDVFYSNIFYLAKLGNMNPEYIESCSPGEYIYFVKQLQASVSTSSSSDSDDGSGSSHAEDDIDEDF